MTPELALTTIPGFSHATIRMVLADGPTNKTVLVGNFESKYVLRLDKPCVKELGLDRIAEEEICRLVASAGLSPEPVYYDHPNGITLRRFVSGTNWLESDLRNPRWLKRLAALMRKLHDLPEVRAKFKPGVAIKLYEEQLGTDEARELAKNALELLDQSSEQQDSTRLCHNDVLNHNIMDSDKPMLIDWEFAGMGDPYFDLAVTVQHHALGKKLGTVLLNAYLQRKPTEAELDRLWINCEFYAALLKLWTLRVADL